MLKRLGERFLTFFCHPDFQEDIKGDLEEHYRCNLEEKGLRYAGLLYFLDAILLFRISLIRRNWISQKSNSIGIRKILGASLLNLMILMSKSFLVLVGIGFLLAAPIGYFFMEDWLNAFEYRVEIGAMVFFTALAASLGITILTVSYHSLKAVYANPVKSLRYE